MGKPLADRVDALAARHAPPIRWHRVIAEHGEPIEALRAMIPAGDGLIVRRII